LNVGQLKTSVSNLAYKGSQAVMFESDLLVDVNLLVVRKKSHIREETMLGEQGPLSYRKWGEENGKSSGIEGNFEGGNFNFRTLDEGVARNGTVPKGSYDFTSAEWPETTMKREGETMEVRFLDLARASVVSRSYRYLRNEDVEVGGKTLHCKVVELSDPNFRCTRWVSGKGGNILLVRQDGKSNGSSYTVRLMQAE
jgi:hypothetical protein